MKTHIIKALKEIKKDCEKKEYTDTCYPCPFDMGVNCMFNLSPNDWDLDRVIKE